MSKRRADRIAGTLVSLIDISMLLRVAAILLVITVSWQVRRPVQT